MRVLTPEPRSAHFVSAAHQAVGESGIYAILLPSVHICVYNGMIKKGVEPSEILR